MAKELLTDRAIRNATPRAKPYRLFDGKGLALLISPTGVKSWQLRYRLDGKDQTATLGKLDLLTLAEARGKAHEQRKLAESGEHLTTVKRTKKIYTMILFGIINYTYTWYDPKGGIGPQEFADMAVDLFLHGFVSGTATNPAAAHRREKV